MSDKAGAEHFFTSASWSQSTRNLISCKNVVVPHAVSLIQLHMLRNISLILSDCHLKVTWHNQLFNYVLRLYPHMHRIESLKWLLMLLKFTWVLLRHITQQVGNPVQWLTSLINTNEKTAVRRISHYYPFITIHFFSIFCFILSVLQDECQSSELIAGTSILTLLC